MYETSVAVLMTCHNRRDLTMASLRALFSAVPSSVKLRAYLVDAGSTDATADAVRREFAEAEVLVIEGGSHLFWAGGMRVARERALDEKPDYFLWLNDDTRLHADSLGAMLAAARDWRRKSGRSPVLVGSTVDERTGKISYGGWQRKSKARRLTFSRVLPSAGRLLPCDALNGNCVLVPLDVDLALAGFDPIFTHGMADFDFGLRAKKINAAVLVHDCVVGICNLNDATKPWLSGNLGLLKALRLLLGPKGFPLAEWGVFVARHGGALAPLYFVSPYLQMVKRVVGIGARK